MSVNNPTLSTSPDQTSVTLGPPVTLKETADLEGGFNPTGTITFTLVGPDGITVVDTEMVLVNGNGPYSTPTGLTPGVTPNRPDLPTRHPSDPGRGPPASITSRRAVIPPVGE